MYQNIQGTLVKVSVYIENIGPGKIFLYKKTLAIITYTKLYTV
jgi:hypothetical protein